MYWHFLTTWRLGLRSRSFQVLVVLALLTMGMAYLASHFSGRQPTTVALDVGVSGIRILGVLLTLFWIQELFVREADRGTLATILTYPLPRTLYVLGRFLGVCALLALTVAIFGILLAALMWGVTQGYTQSTPVGGGLPLVAVLVYIWLDLLTITAFTWLIASLATTPLVPFALGLAFAWTGRSLGPVITALQGGESGVQGLRPGLQPVLERTMWLLPDLSRLDIRSALLYGHWPEAEVLVGAPLNALGYIALLLGVTLWRFNYREFA